MAHTRRRVQQEALGQQQLRSRSPHIEDRLPTFTLGERPQLVLTWGSQFPDKVKVRKRVNFWPLVFKLRFDYTAATGSVNFGCSCRDSLLGGRVRLDLPTSQVEYKKSIRLGGSQIGLTARCSYAGALSGQPLNPRAGIAFEFGSGAAMWAGNVFDLRQKLRLTPNLGVEVCGSAQLPVPRAQYTVSSQLQRMAFGDGPLHLHVAQVNACLDL